MTLIRGVAWRHARAMAPLQALAEVLHDRHGEEVVRWDARSLKSFAEDPLDLFAEDYDLIVFDYPFSGEAIAKGWLHPLETLLPAETLDARRRGSVGRTYDSYVWNGRSAALPLDAATHVSAWREDLLDGLGATAPGDWDETLALARKTGKVAMPLTPTAVWGALIDFCAHDGAPPMRNGEVAFEREAALAAFERLAALARLVPAWSFGSSPVAVLNRMSSTDDVAYCPLTYGYSIYSVDGYAGRTLRFGNMALSKAHGRAGAILGGAGIGVSARSRDPEAAARLAAWLTTDEVQAGLYARAGGQPAAVAAWDDPAADRIAGGFYSGTRASMDGCYHRPNGPGFHAFQTRSANSLQTLLRDGGSADAVFDRIDAGWREMAA